MEPFYRKHDIVLRNYEGISMPFVLRISLPNAIKAVTVLAKRNTCFLMTKLTESENCQNTRINSINELYYLSKLLTKVLICVSQN